MNAVNHNQQNGEEEKKEKDEKISRFADGQRGRDEKRRRSFKPHLYIPITNKIVNQSLAIYPIKYKVVNKRTVLIMGFFKCQHCEIKFSRKGYLKKHLEKKHPNTSIVSSSVSCPFCEEKIDENDLNQHIGSSHRHINSDFEKISSISDNVCIFRKYLSQETKTIEAFCSSNSTVKSIFNLLKEQLINRTAFRVSIAITAKYEIPDLENEEEAQKSVDSDSFTLRSRGQIINQLQNDRAIRNRIKLMLAGAADRNEDLLLRGSGWRFVNLSVCDVLLYQVKLM